MTESNAFTPAMLLEGMKTAVVSCTEGMTLMRRSRDTDDMNREAAVPVYVQSLPPASGNIKEADRLPYIILQFIKGDFVQRENESPSEMCTVRIVIGTYCETPSEGSMSVLNLLHRIVTTFAEKRIIDGCVLVCSGEREESKAEYTMYPDETGKYYFGEIMTRWEMPSPYYG